MEKEIDGIPYYQKLKTMFIEEIKNGNLKYGDKIPSERELADKFGVSRMTARHALSTLEREGFVERRVGVGTFISNRKIQWNFITVNSFTKGMEDKGLKPTTETIFAKIEKADEFLANKLNISNGEEVFSLKRLRIIDDIPVAIELSQIPYKFCLQIEEYISNKISLYQVLDEFYGLKLAKQKQYMRISLSNSVESKLLRIGNETPCLSIEGTTYDSLERPVEYYQTLARGDLIEFYSEPTNPQ